MLDRYKNNLLKKYPDYENRYQLVEYIQPNKIIVKNKYGLLVAYMSNLMAGYIPRKDAAIDKTNYFKNQLLEYNEHYKNGEFEVIGEYKHSHTDIELKTKYGEISASPSNLLKGSLPIISKANYPTKYYLNKLKHEKPELFKQYDFSKYIYIKNNIKSVVICKLHGEFKVTPTRLLAKRAGCKKCGNIKVRNNPTGWGITYWEEHSKKSPNFDSFKVYIIRCWDDNDGEEFYKIGRTFRTLEGRFGKSKSYLIKYNYEVIKIFEGNAKHIYHLENTLKRQNKEYKYRPKKEFRGMYECFKKVNYEL
jgi:hypothetical protein